MKARVLGGRRFLFRSRHKKRSIADQRAESLRRSGRLVRVITENDGLHYVWATSLFD